MHVPSLLTKRACRSVQLAALTVAASLLASMLAACAGTAGAGVESVGSHSPGAGAGATGQASPGALAQVWPAMQLASSPTRVKAKSGALIDAATRQLLWSRGLNTERPMGSITKVMTALVVIDSGDLNQEIRIPKSVLAYVTKYQGESAGLHPGDRLTARQLLEAMLLQSACDAAYVLAVTYGPGMPAFLAKMNATAARLGMTRTHFTSPDGLPYPTEYSTYSTPSDLLMLGLAAMKLPLFRSIVDQNFYHVTKRKGVHHSYWFDNTNELVENYKGAVGIKDGYTDAAKHCLLFEAVRKGTPLIGVVLGSPTTGPYAADQAATRLLNWGFQQKLPAGSGSGSGSGG